MTNPMSLAGSTIVVTGAAQGISLATADLAYRLGATLVMLDEQWRQVIDFNLNGC